MDYVGQKTVNTIGLLVYPDVESAFTLYEDDGITYDYLEGAVALTEMNCRETEQNITLTISPRAGSYEGMPETRSFEIWMHRDKAPEQVMVNGVPLASADWSYDEDERAVKLTATEDPECKENLVILYVYE